MPVDEQKLVYKGKTLAGMSYFYRSSYLVKFFIPDKNGTTWKFWVSFYASYALGL